MVITRSQGDAAEMNEQKRRDMSKSERKLSGELLASPSLVQAAVAGTSTQQPTGASKPRSKSPAQSVQSRRSTTSVMARLRQAELDAAEKLAAITKKELELEADLVKKRLAAEISAIHEEQSIQEEDHSQADDSDRKVNDWLHTVSLDPQREEASAKEKTEENVIKQLAETLEKVVRPRFHGTELPTFSGSPNEWLPFKAAMRDSTRMCNITASENIQRLRSCLKGEARDVVAALLHAATDPDIVMKTLEQCFGRPEIIVDRAFEDLRKLPRLGSSAIDLNNFAVKVQNVTYVLKTIDRREYLYNPMLAREVLNKLSPHLRSRWCDYASDHIEPADPEIVVLSRFLMREADRALKYTYVPSTITTSPAISKEVKGRKSGNIYTVIETTKEQIDLCPSCGETHMLHQCPKYKALTIDQRWDFVRDKKLCFKCVQKKHRRINCKAKACGINQCGRSHHSTLHQDQKQEYPEQEPTSKPTQNNNEAVLSVATQSTTSARAVLLKICPVVVAGPRGEVNTYALLDEGATITLIDEQLARSIGAEGPTQPLHLNGVNMSQRESDSKFVAIKLKGKRENTIHKLRARTIKDLKLHQQSIPAAALQYDHLQDLFPEDVCYESARPRILVGTDHWECIVSRELRVGGPDQPAASRTQLGWVVHGTLPRRVMYNHESTLHIYETEQHIDTREQHDQRLHKLVDAHFRIDALGITCKPRINNADQRAINIVKQTMKRIENGYEVGLPWRTDDVTLPPNYKMAYRRLRKIEQKMDENPEYATGYKAQIQNLLNKGYAVPCDGSEQNSAIRWYLPHFTVQNPNKPGKQRLVFDAAATCNGISLNHQLLEGPDLLLSLQGILFRFREKPIAVTADIQEMFLQIKIRREDQPAQQFLWRDDDRVEPPRCYKMTSMIFGAKSSPFVAHYVRNHNAKVHAQTYPRALEAITRSHYMDDFVASYDDEQEARLAVKETRSVHAVAGFTLREWSTNKKSVLSDVPMELHATKSAQLIRGRDENNKILGLFWNAERDELGFNTTMNRVPDEVREQTRTPSKREALSAVMSIYDPLGLLSHYTIRAKIILQSLWRLKISWDEPIPKEEGELFANWLQHLSEITRLRLKRCYAPKGYANLELHVLCDASEQAYATVAYGRITHYDGSISVTLIAAKAKVAPRRSQTIPRLELQAALIGARLANTIKKEHRMEETRIIYWTDSTTVVHWIRNETQQYTPFVAHRLGEIAELTQKEEWRWLSTSDNVADDATRFSRTSVSSSDRWFQGPSFLYKPEEQWPTERAPAVEEEVILYTQEKDSQRDNWLPDPTRFSKYETLVRATARALAFIDICRRKSTRMEHRHVECAERKLIQHAQQESFGPELQKLESNRSITKTSRLFKLDPALEDGILRVRGRIGAATTLNETKQPIILDGRHYLTKLIVMREHCAAGHANRERVTNDLRQRYWVIHLRPTVRAIERSCTFCRVRRAKPRTPVTGDLPRARLDPFHRPFTNCGVDYFGPMMVKVGRRQEKRWGALFTCLTSRAVHIELVASLSTDSAIMALRRMAARRGWPRLMYSDNATNFRGADRELRAAYIEWAPRLREEGLLHRMEWRYISPGAPNQGGAWERLIRSVKTALNVTLREKVPPEEVLNTLLTEAEFSINARPLTHVSVSPNDPEALTPNHFLLGSSMGLPTTGPCDKADRRTWRASQALADQFWRRWVREYLPTLVPRGESANKQQPLRVGDIVAIVDHRLPRNIWPIGIVERTYEGPDGGIRVADLHSEYRSTYRWHEYTGNSRPEVVRKPPVPNQFASSTDHFFSKSMEDEKSIEGPTNEPPLPRRKKCPELAYRSHDFISGDAQPTTNFRNDSEHVTRARSEERGTPSRRSKSAGPPGVANGRAYPYENHVADKPNGTVPGKAGESSGLFKKTITKLSTEYRLQFVWPHVRKAIKGESNNAIDTPRKSLSMGAIKSSHAKAMPTVHKKRTANEKEATAYELEPLVNDAEERRPVEKSYEHRSNRIGDHDRQNHSLTRKENFGFSDETCEKGPSTKQHMMNGTGPYGGEWYRDMIELRKKAGEYKCRGWGVEIDPDLCKKQKELWDQVSRRSSLSALSLASSVHRPITKEEKEHENNKKSSPTKSARGRVPGHAHFVDDKTMPDGPILPARVQTIRHHLERTTGPDVEEGALLPSPTREKLMPTIPKSKESEPYSSQRGSPKKSATSRHGSPQKGSPQKGSPKKTMKGRSQSVGPSVIEANNESPKRQNRSVSTAPHAAKSNKKTPVSTPTTGERRPRPSTLSTTTHSRSKSSSLPPSGRAIHSASGIHHLQSISQNDTNKTSTSAAGPTSGAGNQSHATMRHKNTKSSKQIRPKSAVVNGLANNAMTQSTIFGDVLTVPKNQDHKKLAENDEESHEKDGGVSIASHSPQPPQTEITEHIVKSPPEPTRVKSPEQIIMRSPDPVNWTVPLDTGKTFTVTQNVKDGENFSRPQSEVKASTPIERPPPAPQSAPPELAEQAKMEAWKNTELSICKPDSEGPGPAALKTTPEIRYDRPVPGSTLRRLDDPSFDSEAPVTIRTTAADVLEKARDRFDRFWGTTKEENV